MDDLDQRAAKIRLLCTDIDGVLTSGALHYGQGPGHTKAFHVRDGAAIKWLQRSGIQVAFISGLASEATEHRARDLGVADCFAGHLDKGPVLDQLCAKYSLACDQIAHLGDDLPDLPLLRRVGLACCPSDAVAEVQAACHWVTPVAGGQGILRLVAERILKSQGLWDAILSHYEVHGLLPMSDLRDLTNGQLGVGVYGFVEIPVGEGFLLRPTVGAQQIPKGNTLGLAGTQTSVTSVDLVLDALWFPGDNAQHGPYLVGTVGGQQWRVSATGTTPSATSATRLGVAGGIGYQFSARLGIEAKGFWSPIEKNLTATGLTAGATWRF